MTSDTGTGPIRIVALELAGGGRPVESFDPRASGPKSWFRVGVWGR